jgi:hypothetical protein
VVLIKHAREGPAARDHLIPACRALVLDDKDVRSALVLDCHDDLCGERGCRGLVVCASTVYDAGSDRRMSVWCAGEAFAKKVDSYFPSGRFSPKVLVGYWSVEHNFKSTTCWVEHKENVTCHRHYDGGCWGFVDNKNSALRQSNDAYEKILRHEW